MSANNKTNHVPDPISQLLLDIYSEKTQLPVALYQTKLRTFMWSRKGFYSPLCKKLNTNLNLERCKSCEDDHISRVKDPKGQLEICHAGLWNISIPIIIGNEVVAILISGQRRLDDERRGVESKAKFEHYLSNVKGEDITELRKCFENTPIIKQTDFDSHFLDSLKSIQEYLFKWMLTQSDEDKQRRNKIQKLAHEFLLPIQSIIADAENLYNEIESVELKDIAENILLSMQHLANISENMRGSLIEAKEQPYHFSRYNLYKCLINSSNMYRKEASKKGVDIRKPYIINSEKFPEIEMSREDLTRAFKNIIHNAVKYSYSSSEHERFIRIVGEPGRELFCVTVSNYGIGILQDEIVSGKIFQDGYRGVLSADRFRTGSGMGLAEVKKIIEKHSGRVSIACENKGIAYLTEVRVYLPYYQK